MSAISTVSEASLFLGNTNPNSTQARTPHTSLDQQDFLKLLVTKMSAQDPMNPQGDQEFIAQMAQFTSLEQSKTMTSNVESLNASGLIGRSVSLKADGAGQKDINGEVSAITFKDGSPQLVVGGNIYDLSRVTGISPYIPEIPTVPTLVSPKTDLGELLGALPMVA
jgi:flagellar basal-body rod modification protein FlgD